MPTSGVVRACPLRAPAGEQQRGQARQEADQGETVSAPAKDGAVDRRQDAQQDPCGTAHGGQALDQQLQRVGVEFTFHSFTG
jgi:hypothetical protein